MGRSVNRQLYIIIFLLSLLFVSLVLGFFIINQKEQQSHEYVTSIFLIEKQIGTIKKEFWELRFWERQIVEQSDMSAEKEFGKRIKLLHADTENFASGDFRDTFDNDAKNISQLLDKYELVFNKIVQLKTEQGLTQTLMVSNYYSLSSILKDKNETTLLKMHINLGRYQTEYLTYKRDSQYYSMLEMNRILENEIAKTPNGSIYYNYTQQYVALAQKHFQEKQQIEELNAEFDTITVQLLNNLDVISEKVNGLSMQQLAYQNTLKKTMYYFFGISIVIELFFLLAIIYLLEQKIVVPIKSLSKLVDEVKAGNLNARYSSDERDEIARLGFTLNEMLQHISESHDAIEARSQKIEQKDKELHSANLQLKELDKLKDSFLTMTSHELRTPITPMKAEVEMLLKGFFGKLTKDQRSSLELILKNTIALDALIADIVDISRIQSGTMKMLFKKSSMAGIIEESIATMRPKAQMKRVEIVFVKKPTPLVLCDPNRVRQVVINLVNNAIKFTDEGGTITVELHQEKDSVLVMVKDTGIGIAKEDIGKLFSPFVQLDTGLNRTYEGTGLGLSICKGIIERHSGSITVKSPGKGKGSDFSFRLPLK